jgi:ADP-dependent NAD(P)H-hydrate dehydratase / NAD(P)H-hydrate epimerase
MRLVTSAQMAAIDRRSIEEHGIPGYTLMQRAGQAVVDELVARSGSVAGDLVAVLCGRGNNGGDGFVIARLLRELKADVRCYLIAEKPDAVAGSAKEAMDAWQQAGGETTNLVNEESIRAIAASWSDADYIIDGLLGTGLVGDVRGVVKAVIEAVSMQRVPVIAIDIPSGIDGDTGAVLGAAIQASLTVTFGLPKVGHAFHPGKRYCGTLVVADIGFPSDAVEAEAGRLFLTGSDDARGWVPHRVADAHKGSQGTVFLIAGSVGMTGAAALSSEAALRVGCGLSYLACPESLNDVLEGMVREVVTKPMPEVGKRRCFALRGLGQMLREAENMDVIAIGPGIGRHRETAELVRRFVQQSGHPMVIDADGLFALSPESRPANLSAEEFGFDGRDVVLTPHYGEMSRLIGVDIAQIKANPLAYARAARDTYRATVLLKGDPTVVCGPSGEEWVNTSGNSGMASGGMGDVLTGTIAGLIAQGLGAEKAARLGAYVHGLAGDLARDELGLHGMIAGDVLARLPTAMKKLSDPE